MAFSRVEAAQVYPCPVCGVDEGVFCWPRAADDAPWVHKFRAEVFEYNRRLSESAYNLVVM